MNRQCTSAKPRLLERHNILQLIWNSVPALLHALTFENFQTKLKSSASFNQAVYVQLCVSLITIREKGCVPWYLVGGGRDGWKTISRTASAAEVSVHTITRNNSHARVIYILSVKIQSL